jgi:hypothetical protein
MRKTLLLLPALPITLLLQACPPVDDDDADDEPPINVVDQYFAGDSTTTLASGTALAAERTLIWRRLFPDDGRIEEHVEQVTEDGVLDSTVHLVVDADGAFSLSLTDAFGTQQGSGDLTGAAWAWTAWTSTSTYVDGDRAGATVARTATLDDDGLLATHELLDADGDPMAATVQTLAWTDPADWHEEAEVLGEGP